VLNYNFVQGNTGEITMHKAIKTPIQTHSQHTTRVSPFTPLPTGLLQHKCICGSTPGPSGECVECRKKSLTGQQPLVQTKPIINQPDDRYEEEADQVADMIMCMPETGHQSHLTGFSSQPMQRQPSEAEELQAKPSPAQTPIGGETTIAPALGDRIQSLRAGGRPLDPITRAFMEPRFGHDFSQVRVHTDAAAAEKARVLHARAFTLERDVVFGAGQYAPTTDAGRALIAHELAHVVQQGVSWRHIPVQRVALPEDGALEEVPKASPQGTAEEVAEEVAEVAAEPVSMDMTLERLDRDGDASFLSTDLIIFQAGVTGVPHADELANRIQWTVHGISARSGGGNPHSASNKAYFSFTPNPTNRPTTGVRGVANDPIQYKVEARVPQGVIKFYDLKQDESDIIRQEYIDLGPVTPPWRLDLEVPADPRFNTGNYHLIVDRGMSDAFRATEANFARLRQAAAPGAPVPAIHVESGYRNPRRNVAAGSEYPVTSRHVWGRALDLIADSATAQVWDALRRAGLDAGYASICEYRAKRVSCNDPSVNHVHIEWE